MLFHEQDAYGTPPAPSLSVTSRERIFTIQSSIRLDHGEVGPHALVPLFFQLFLHNIIGIQRCIKWLLLWMLLLHLIDDAYAQTSSLSVARSYLAASTAMGKIVFAGGRFPTSNAVDIYDINTGQWNSTSTGAGSLSVPRFALAAASLGNIIVFAGGLYVSVPSSSNAD